VPGQPVDGADQGYARHDRPLIEDERARRQRMRRRNRKGMPVEPIGVDQGKALIYARLKLTEPGKGYIHFPIHPAFDDEYFAQLAAEKLVTKTKGHRPFQEWVQTRARNEALDCMVYALAALRLSGRANRSADKKTEDPTKQAVENAQQKTSFIPKKDNFIRGRKR